MPTTRVGDVDLYYELRGEGPGLPAVLLMGLGTDLNGWDHVTPRLEQRRQLLLIDNRGVGRSAKPRGPYTTTQLADDALGVMKAVGWERAHVVGVSLGGAIAQELALKEPDRVRSLALLATFTDLDRQMEQTADEGLRATMRSQAADMNKTLQTMAESGVAVDPRAIFGFLMPLVFTPEFLKREKKMLRETFERAMAHGISLEGFAGQLAAAWSHKTRERLGELRHPTLVVLPSADRLVPPAQSRALAAAIPGARLHELEGGVHGFIVEQAELAAEVIDGWLAENDPS